MSTRTITKRTLELLRRAGRDKYSIDKRPLSVMLNDEIPYARWDKALKVLKRAGYNSMAEKLYGRRCRANFEEALKKAPKFG